MKLSLVTVPHPALTAPTKPVNISDKRTQEIIKEMIRVLNSCRDPEGVGLAATQVGLALRLFIIKPYSKSPVTVFVNPQIEQVSKAYTHRQNALEGCLSVTNTWSSIERPKWVVLTYQDESGTKHTRKFTGWEAQIIQHEMDHLEGVLFTQRALEQEKELYRIAKKHGKEELVEIDL